jgi:hypothetical protein
MFPNVQCSNISVDGVCDITGVEEATHSPWRLENLIRAILCQTACEIFETVLRCIVSDAAVTGGRCLLHGKT